MGTAEEREPLEQPLDGILDLHTFRPTELGTLIPDYLEACRASGVLQVRLIHGKGTGALCRSVHALLSRLPSVVSFRLGGIGGGGWGATVVWLVPSPKSCRARGESEGHPTVGEVDPGAE